MLAKLNKPLWWLYLFTSAQLLYGQPAIFLQGNHLEIAVTQGGYYHTTFAPPAVFHPTSTSGFGLVADVRKSDWLSATSPAYCGDYFNPGTAIEGFAIEIDGAAFQANAASSGSGDMIPGLVTMVENGPGLYRYAVWEGVAAAGALDVRQTTLFFRNRQYVYTVVDLCNSGPLPLEEIFYSRNWDPDNEHAWSGSFATSHTVISQPPAEAHAALRTEGSLFGCYMETVSADARARVSYGGFFQGSPSASWNGSFPYQLSGSRAADESNQISFNIGTLDTGACTCLSYVTVFMEMERPGAVSRLPLACGEISNLLADPDNYNLAAALDPFNPALQERAEPSINFASEALVYPNPTTGRVNFNFEGQAYARLFDQSGRLLYETLVDGASALELGRHPSGIYLLQLSFDDRVEHTMLVLE